MKKHSTDFKYEVVKAVIEDNYSKGEVSRRYGLHRTIVQRWLSLYLSFGIEGLKSKVTKEKYTGQFKLNVIEDIQKNKLSYRQAMTKYNISSDSVIRKWKLKYDKEGIEGFLDKVEVEKPLEVHEVIEKDLIAEIRQLRMENDYLKKLNALVQNKRK